MNMYEVREHTHVPLHVHVHVHVRLNVYFNVQVDVATLNMSLTRLLSLW